MLFMRIAIHMFFFSFGADIFDRERLEVMIRFRSERVDDFGTRGIGF